jgi:hypothetical protein
LITAKAYALAVFFYHKKNKCERFARASDSAHLPDPVFHDNCYLFGGRQAGLYILILVEALVRYADRTSFQRMRLFNSRAIYTRTTRQGGSDSKNDRP